MENSLRSLLWLGRERRKKMKRGGERVVQKVTRVDAGLAMRVHVYSATMYQGKKKEKEKRQREKGARAQGVKVKVIYCVHE